MIYFLKFIAAWLLPPGLFVLLAGVLTYKLWQRRKTIGLSLGTGCFVLTLLLYFSSTVLGAKFLALPLETKYQQSNPAQAQLIVVLGGGSVGGTPDSGESGNLTATGATRLLTAARLAKQHNLPVLISGGQVFSDGASEAQVSRRILRQLGMSDGRIIVEEQARTTQENARYTAQLCKERGVSSMLLVTSAMHMQRSVHFFERYLGAQGVKILPYPCDYTLNQQNKFNVRWLVPQAEAFNITCSALHEYVGMLGAWASEKFLK